MFSQRQEKGRGECWPMCLRRTRALFTVLSLELSSLTGIWQDIDECMLNEHIYR